MQTNFFSTKKSIGSYILIVIIISILFTLLIISVTSIYYGEDPEQCKYIKYDFSEQCKDGNLASINVRNEGSKLLVFKINGKEDPEYSLAPQENKLFRIKTINTDKIEFIPLVQDGGKKVECRGKIKTINSEVLMKC